MTRRLLFTLVMCAFAAAAQDKASFAGTWKLNASKSDYGPMPAPDKLISKIAHEDPKLEVASEVSNQQGEFTTNSKYTTDGKECTNTNRGFEIKSTVKWDGAALMFESRGNFNGNDVTFKDKWMLGADGKTMTIARHITAPQGELDQTQVFEKQ
ncbi:MAG: hypothetical protein HY013_17555 [Candidatus Solibacter usitatus]|nr:hypothetical protein [Candidatus Solibacter usitatus]